MASHIRFIGDPVPLRLEPSSDEVAEELSLALDEDRMAVFEHAGDTLYVNPRNVLFVRNDDPAGGAGGRDHEDAHAPP